MPLSNKINKQTTKTIPGQSEPGSNGNERIPLIFYCPVSWDSRIH